MTRKILLLVLPLSLLLVSSKCGGGSATVSKIKADKMARIAHAPFLAPMIYQKGQEYVGPDADLATQIVEKMNGEWLEGDASTRKIRIVHVARATKDLASVLKNNEADLILGGFAVTSPLKEELDFSDVYYTSELRLTINPLVAKNLRVNNMKGQKIGVREGSGAEDATKSKGGEVVPLPTLDDAILALKNGEIAGVVDDKYMLGFALDTIPAVKHLEIVPDSVGSLDCAIAVRKGEEQMLLLVNDVIKQMKAGYGGKVDEHDAGHLAAVLPRFDKRIRDDENATKARQVYVSVQRAPGSRVDIYRMANQVFQVDPGGRTTSRLEFQGRVGSCSVSLPPGEYLLFMPRFNLRAPVTVSKNDGVSIRITITIQADNSVSVRRS